MNDRIDPEQRTLVFQRTIDASPHEVFDAWTRPDEIAEWWDPTGTRLVECTIDLRVGGAFRFVNAGHGPPFAGVYTAIERPTKLAFDAMGAKGSVSIEPAGARVRLEVRIVCASDEHFATFVRLGVADGTSKTLDNLAARFGAHRPQPTA